MDSGPASEPHAFRIGAFIVEPARNLLILEGEDFKLEPRIMDLLCALAGQPGEVISRGVLLDTIWKVEHGADESLTRAISLLRKTFRQAGEADEYIETIAKRGYRLQAPVADLDGAPVVPAAAPRARWYWPVAGLVVALVGFALIFSFWPRPDAPVPGSTDPVTAAHSSVAIAVLPFVDMSPDGDQEYFADGISEELLNTLAQIQGLEVAGRTSSFVFKGNDRDLREIGEILKVSHILEGSVRKDGNQVRITAQLINAADGFHLWSAAYDRELTDIFAVQDEIARAILTEMSPLLPMGTASAASLKSTPRTEISTYELFFLARELMTQDGNRAAYERARDLLDEALAIDPDYLPALGWRVYVEGSMSEAFYGVGDTPAEQARPLIKAMTDRAMAIDPNSADALFALVTHLSMLHFAEGYHLLEPVLEAQRKVIALRPNFSLMKNDHAFVLRVTGETGQSLEVIEDILAHDPGIHDTNTLAITLFRLLGRPEDARKVLERWRRIRPDHEVPDIIALSLLYEYGDLAAAWRETERFQPTDGSVKARLNAYRDIIRYRLHDGGWLKNNSVSNTHKAFGMLLDGDPAQAALMSTSGIKGQSVTPWRAFSYRIPFMFAAGDDAAIIDYYDTHIGSPDVLIRSTLGCECGPAQLLSVLKSAGHRDFGPAMEVWATLAERDRDLFSQSPLFTAKEARRAALNEDFDLARQRYTRAMDLGWREPLFLHKDYRIDLPDTPEFEALYARMTALINAERAALSMAPF